MSHASGQGDSGAFWSVRPFRRHSLVLLVAGLSYIIAGLIHIGSMPTENRRVALVVALEWLPIQFWGSVFIVVGSVAIVAGLLRAIPDVWGYMLLTGFSAGWSATYAAGVVFEHSPINNLTGTLNWGLLAFLWWAVSGFVNPDKTIVVVIKDNDGGDC